MAHTTEFHCRICRIKLNMDDNEENLKKAINLAIDRCIEATDIQDAEEIYEYLANN